MQAERPSLSSSPSLNAYVHDHPTAARSCCNELTPCSGSDDQQFQQKQRERRREGNGDKNVEETERPSLLSSSPSLNAYVQPPLVHDHRKIVRNCSDEPTTRVQRSESESDRQDHQNEERKREEEGERDKVVEVENDSNNSGAGGGGFEFSFNCAAAPSPISADQIFHNGKIKPTLPIYEVASFCPEEEVRKTSEAEDLKLKIAVDKMVKTTSRRKALRRLFIEERSHSLSHSSPSTSASSSETDEASESSASAANELDSVPSDSYCVWKPKTTSSSSSASLGASDLSKKSESAGSSKRWKLKDLLTRNNSERDVNSQSQSQRSSSNEQTKSESGKNEKVRVVAAAPQLARKMAMKEGGGGGERRRSYLPYRQELVGIFGSSGSGRNLQRF